MKEFQLLYVVWILYRVDEQKNVKGGAFKRLTPFIAIFFLKRFFGQF